MKTLSEVKLEVDRLAAKIGALGHSELPAYGGGRSVEGARIEVDSNGYHYVVCERGEEFKRLTTLDLDALLYRVFSHATSCMSINYELMHRVETQDCRRLGFKHQVELLSQLSKSWGERQLQEQERILRDHPFDDASGVRVALTKKLMDSGHSYEAAWQLACEQYPLPSPL